MIDCPITPSDLSYLSDLTGYIDCQAAHIGARGWQALAQPGSQVALLLTSLLTIFVALFGYRLMLGHVPDIREGVVTLARVGVVLALATSWQAYRTVAYDVALRAPGEIAADIGGAARLPGTAGLMAGHLDAVDRQFQTLAIAGVGGPIRFDEAQQYPPPLFTGFDTFALGAARTAFIVGVLGSLGSVRLLAGILLALGPLFLGFLLFEATRELFQGWLKALAGAALGSLVVSIMLGVELALLEPWLNQLIERRNAGEAILMAPGQLLALSTVFALFLLASVAVGLRLAWAASFPIVQITKVVRAGILRDSARSPAATVSMAAFVPVGGDVSRASLLADSIHRLDQRQISRASLISNGARTGPVAANGSIAAGTTNGVPSPGSASRRNDPARKTASATRRDNAR